MVLISTLTASLVTNSGRSAWFVGVLVLMVYLIFAMTLYLLPPRVAVKLLCAAGASLIPCRTISRRVADRFRLREE